MAPTPYLDAGDVQLYHGDMRDILPTLGLGPAVMITDPPYAVTKHRWDCWPEGWPTVAATVTDTLWCFGSMRMWMERAPEFAGWKYGQDVVWEKPNGSGFTADKFKRVHEHAVHFYRGKWGDQHRAVPTIPAPYRRGGSKISMRSSGEHLGVIGRKGYEYGPTRLARSVIRAATRRTKGGHPTEKPGALLAALIQYSTPAGGLVVDPFAGSGSTATVARLLGHQAVLIEGDERYCETIARRLAQPVLPLTA